MRRPLALSALAAVTVLSGCAGDSASLTGVWVSADATDSGNSLTVYKDQRVSVVGDGFTCSGAAKEQDEGTYRIDVDCGTRKGTLTAKITGSDSLDLTLGTKTSSYRRKKS